MVAAGPAPRHYNPGLAPVLSAARRARLAAVRPRPASPSRASGCRCGAAPRDRQCLIPCRRPPPRGARVRPRHGRHAGAGRPEQQGTDAAAGRAGLRRATLHRARICRSASSPTAPTRTPEQYADSCSRSGFPSARRGGCSPRRQPRSRCSCGAGHRRVMVLGGKGITEPLEAAGHRGAAAAARDGLDAVMAGWFRQELTFERWRRRSRRSSDGAELLQRLAVAVLRDRGGQVAGHLAGDQRGDHATSPAARVRSSASRRSTALRTVGPTGWGSSRRAGRRRRRPAARGADGAPRRRVRGRRAHRHRPCGVVQRPAAGRCAPTSTCPTSASSPGCCEPIALRRVPRTAQARAVRWIEPSAAIGSRSRTASRSAARSASPSDIDVGRGRAGAAEERRPVVVEVAEVGRDDDRPRPRRRRSPASANSARSGSGRQKANRAASSSGRARRVEGHGGVPEVRHQLHLAGVVPDVGGDGPAGPGGAAHLGQGGRPVGDEVEDQPRDDDVERAVVHRERPGVAGAERGARVGHLRSRVLAEGVGGLDADDLGGRAAGEHGLGERAGAASRRRASGRRAGRRARRRTRPRRAGSTCRRSSRSPARWPRSPTGRPIRSPDTSEKPSVARATHTSGNDPLEAPMSAREPQEMAQVAAETGAKKAHRTLGPGAGQRVPGRRLHLLRRAGRDHRLVRAGPGDVGHAADAVHGRGVHPRAGAGPHRRLRPGHRQHDAGPAQRDARQDRRRRRRPEPDAGAAGQPARRAVRRVLPRRADRRHRARRVPAGSARR